MGRFGWSPERRAREIADIVVPRELHPGPSLVLIIDCNSLPVERLGLERRSTLRSTPERRARSDDPHNLPRRVSRRIDMAAQMLRRQIGAGWSQSVVEEGGRHGRRLTWAAARATGEERFLPSAVM